MRGNRGNRTSAGPKFNTNGDSNDQLLDEWDLEDTGYDPDRVYTQVTNDHDHSVTMATRVTPELAGIVAAYVHSDVWPEYESTSHFLRDAIYHWAEQRKHQRKDGLPMDAQRMLDRQRLLSDQQSMDQELKAHQEIIDRARTLFNGLQMAGDHVALVNAVEFHRARADTYDEPWRTNLLAVCKQYTFAT